MTDLTQAEVEDYILHYAVSAEQVTGVDIRRLLELGPGRVLVKQWKAGRLTRANLPDLNHVCDWLVAAVVNDEPWLKRFDAKGRPLKLMKFGTVAQIEAEADKAMRKARNRGGVPDSELTAEVTMALRDGYRIVRLTTPAELDDESRRLGHCVGNGSYDAAVSDGKTEIHSLRDRFGKSHVTIESVAGLVTQIKGKQNEIPKPEYFSLVSEWLEAQGRRLSTRDRPAVPFGLAVNAFGRIVDLSTLRSGDTFEGDLDIVFEAQLPFPLPEGVTVDGDLSVRGDWSNDDIEFRMPHGLDVRGRLDVHDLGVAFDEIPGRAVRLSRCSVMGLPENVSPPIAFDNCSLVRVSDARTLFSSAVEFHALEEPLPAGWRYADDVEASGMVRLPAGMDVGGRLTVSGSGLAFGGPLAVGGDMKVSGCRVEGSDHPLRIGGNLIYGRCHLARMSPDTHVGGDLTLYKVDGLYEVPEEVRVGGDFKLDATDVVSLGNRCEFPGSLSINAGKLESLADGLSVGGDLAVYHGALKALPRRSKIGGSLVVLMTDIAAIPDDIEVGRSIGLRGTRIGTLPEGMHVFGDLDISHTGRPFELPETITVDGTFVANVSSLTRIPAGAKLGALLARDSDLASLPEGFTVTGDLDVSGSLLRELPEYLSVGGALDVERTGIARIPDTACVLGGIRSGPALTDEDTKGLGATAGRERIAAEGAAAAAERSRHMQDLQARMQEQRSRLSDLQASASMALRTLS